MPREPELIPRLLVRAHGFSAQNVFDWFDPHLSMRSGREVENSDEPTSQLEHPCRRISASRPAWVMGRRLRLFSPVPPVVLDSRRRRR